ncbi:HNH endonuclease [Salinisphaera hydrothermalis C41B8]|uniref:HNH endonuclease n=1 Tax=Salinisphaera hydrothermalis (strain C41B8) TaxID=1304275 RepID=A0A084INQ4_SALHC|nr:HNH endonuclease [Salinisphaera hydrothermalis C41B8]
MCCHQDWRCTYCGHHLTSRHLDHVVPVSRGGTNNIENLQWLCPTCNLRKGTISSEKFISRNGAFGRKSDPIPDSFDLEAFVSAAEAGDISGALDIIDEARK